MKLSTEEKRRVVRGLEHAKAASKRNPLRYAEYANLQGKFEKSLRGGG